MLAAGAVVLVVPGCQDDTPGEAPAPTRAPATNVAPTAETAASPVATAEPTPTAGPAVWEPPTETRITSNADFYTMKYHPSPPPEVDEDSYRLEVVGEVDNPLSLSLEQLKTDFAAHTEMRTLECISNPVGGNLIGNAVWTGLAMADLLAAAGVRSAGRFIKMESLDDYHTGIPMSLALKEHSLLVYEMNGEPLPAEHGYPLRALWPGHYGQKQPKWLHRITVQRQPHTGHWEGQGWSDEAVILPNSRIEQPPARQLQPADFYIGGVAFTTDVGLAKLEVSIDNGSTWQEAELLRGPSPLVWTHWWLPVSGLSSGTYQVLARVTDNNGAVQPFPSRGSSLLDGTFPDGADEMHRVIVQVKTS